MLGEIYYTTILNTHGRSKDICEWVINTYEKNEGYKDNLTVQQWIEASKECLKEEHGISSSPTTPD